ncbi:MAG TPA: hypothetical protein VKB76_01105, partial [Ktedonobacterales bacterium]|nr:hypothetical protein [Ktedonobacterales bacterium]
QRIDFSQEPCAALCDINNIHCYLLLIRYMDTQNAAVFGNQPQGGPLERSLICVLQAKDWWVANQGMGLISIVSAALAETNSIVCYGSSGSDITPLFIDDGGNVTFILKTPLTAHNNLIINKHAIKAGIAISAVQPQSITMLIESENQVNAYTISSAKPLIWQNAASEIITWTNNETPPARMAFMVGPKFATPYLSVDAYGHVLGATLFSNTNSMSISAWMCEYIDADLWSEQVTYYAQLFPA